MNTPTRKAESPADLAADLLNLGIPRPARIPSRCGPVEAVPVSAASPLTLSRPEARRLASRARNEAVDARFRFGVDSDEFRTLSAVANEALDLFLATDEDDEPSDEDEPKPYVGSETWAENWIDHCERIGVKP